jgi:hypothetical protein
MITNDFVSELLKFVNKIDSQRIYEFYFIDNVIYIKYDFTKNYYYLDKNIFPNKKEHMEIANKSVFFHNFDSYVEFYLEIKSILELLDTFQKFYYKKTI